MTGLIANENSSSKDVVISSESFFPSISSKEVREFLRFNTAVTDQRILGAIENAVIEVNEQLESLKSKANTLAEISSKTISRDGIEKPIAEVLYFRAVASCVGAEISEKYRSYDTTASGSENAEKLSNTIDDYKRELRFAIRDIKKLRRLNVELI